MKKVLFFMKLLLVSIPLSAQNEGEYAANYASAPRFKALLLWEPGAEEAHVQFDKQATGKHSRPSQEIVLAAQGDPTDTNMTRATGRKRGPEVLQWEGALLKSQCDPRAGTRPCLSAWLSATTGEDAWRGSHP